MTHHRYVAHGLLALLLTLTLLPAGMLPPPLAPLAPAQSSAQASAIPFLALTSLPGNRRSTTSVALGDLNADGTLDLVVGNNTDPSQVFLNNGNGSFALPTDITSSALSTNSVALGDLNADGALDIVLGNALLPSQLFLNDGHGRFVTSSDLIDSRQGVSSVAIGDLNADGALDIVLGNGNITSLSQVFLNDGQGGFAAPSDIPDSGHGIRSLALGDLNADGALDMVLGNYSAPSQIFLNSGQGSFAAPTDIPGSGLSTTSLALGDLNADGALDIVLGNYSAPSQIVLNSGSGGFAAPSNISGSGLNTLGVALGDLNADGTLDLIIGNDATLWQIALNNGPGSFGTPVSIPDSGKSNMSLGVALGDLNGDGALDMLLGNSIAPSQVALNDARSSFTLRSDIAGSGSNAKSVALGDLNGDGALDLIISNLNALSQVFLNNGHGGFAPPTDITSGGLSANSVVIGDLNADGSLDLVISNDSNPIQVFLNNGHGGFAPPTDIPSNGIITSSMALGDLNADGSLDLVIGSIYGSGSWVFLNNGQGSFGTPSNISGSGANINSVALGDLNGDGALDMVLGNFAALSQIALNDGQGGFTPPTAILGSGQNTYGVALGDLNGDGALDMVLGNSNSPSQIFLNDGQGGFALPSDISGSGRTTTSVALGDLNGDSALDLVIGNSNAPSQVFLNDGRGSFAASSDLPSGTLNANSVALGDLNGDGTLDIVLGNNGTPSQTYLHHNGFVGQVVGTPPLISVGQPGRTPAANFYAAADILSTRIINIPFTLADAEGDAVREVQAEYSLDGGGRWLPAIPATGTITHDLAASPSGVAHTFAWDSVASNVFGQSDHVIIRMKAIASSRPQARRVAGSYIAAASVWASNLPFRLIGTIARVVDTSTKPVPDALVYHLPSGKSRNGPPLQNWLTGTPLPSLASGYVASRDALKPGDQLIAVQTITTTGNLSFTYTSATPTPTGIAALTMGTTGGIQTLTIAPSNPLLLLNLSVGLEWDASGDTAFMESLRARLHRTSEILYDWSNGQVALGSLTIYQNKNHWDHTFNSQGAVITRGVDLRIYASNQIRPNATQGGIINRPTTVSYPNAPGGARTASYEPGYIRIGTSWNANGDPGIDVAEDWAKALAHEVGHYAFYLDETYLGKQGNLLVPVSGCASPMADPYTDSASEFRPASDWPAACQTTLQHLGTGLSEWTMITSLYNRTIAADGFAFSLNVPAMANSNPGPALLPIGVTTITEPSAADTSAASETYGVIPPGGGRYEPSPSARALIFPSGSQLPIDLGAPEAGQVLARGYRAADRLCVFDSAQSLLGCNLSPSGLQLHSTTGWHPELQITPITYPGASGTPTMTLRIAIPSATVANDIAPSTLQLQLYPREGTTAPMVATLPLASGFYRADLALPEVIEEGLVRIWIDNDPQGREAVSDYAVGGNPAPRSKPPARSRKRAPAVSPDGQATLFAEDSVFAPGQFFALQRASSLPALPPWAAPVGQGYRLLASDPTMLSNLNNPIALSLSYAQGDVPLGLEGDVRVLFYDGTSWAELPTRVDSARNEAAISVQPTPGIYVLITSLRLSIVRPGWSLLYAYPGATQALPLALKSAQDQGAYDMVYGYSPADTGDPWKVFSPQVPAWVNDLAGLEEGTSYWLHLLTPATIALPIPVANLNAEGLLPAPPSTVYGTLDASWGFSPEADLTVQALVGTTICGSTTSRDIGGGKIGFVLDSVALDGNALGCGSNGEAATIQVLSGSSILKEVRLSWQNDQIREVGPNGVVRLNRAFLPLLSR